MRLASKHGNVRIFTYSDFTGGMNLSKSPELLADNEVQMMINFEFDQLSGELKTRSGLKSLLSASEPITNLFYAKNINTLFAVIGQTLYRIDGNTLASIGTLSGTGSPVFAEWGNSVLIASGAYLQKTDGYTLTTISNAPQCGYVFVQVGRVIVCKRGDDTLYFSGIGDETNWNFTGTSADALMLQVGYKDGGNIVAVQQLVQDLIVFKDNRRIYRVTGYYPNWVVHEVSRDAGLISPQAVVPIGSSLVFIDEADIKTLDTVIEYGDVKVSGFSDKVETYVKRNIVAQVCRVWHVRPKGQVWFKLRNDEFVLVFSYIHKAWLLFKLPSEVQDVISKNNQVYLSLGNKLYHMSDDYADDDGAPIEAQIKMARRIALRQFLLKRGRVLYQSNNYGNAVLRIDNFYKSLLLFNTSDFVYSDTDIAYNDTDPVFVQDRNEIKFMLNKRLSYLEPEIIVNQGSMKFISMILEVAEV